MLYQAHLRIPFRIVEFFIFCILIISATSCLKEDTKESEPEPQKVSVHIFSYLGTARCMPLEKHDLYLFLKSNDRQIVATAITAESDEILKKGDDISFSFPVNPGYYKLDGYWDWDNDEKQASYEPIVAEISFEVKGYKPVEIMTNIVDQTSINDPGWVTGKISYEGNISGLFNVYIVIQDKDYNVISEIKATRQSPVNLHAGDFHFVSGSVPPGIYMRVVAYWDVDKNGTYSSSDPIGDRAGTLIISPGLPTVGINITLNK